MDHPFYDTARGRLPGYLGPGLAPPTRWTSSAVPAPSSSTTWVDQVGRDQPERLVRRRLPGWPVHEALRTILFTTTALRVPAL